jgi:hypothetical protein
MSCSAWRCGSERIVGRNSGLQQRVVDVEQRSEERFILLEMTCTEANAEHVEMDKQMGSLKLKVGCIDRFLERESMANSHTKPGIINTIETAPAPPPSSNIFDGPYGHRVPHHHRDRESGSVDTHPHIPVNGTNQTKTRVPEHSHELGHPASHSTDVDSMRVSQGRFPKIQFQVFSGEDPQLWRSRCENYFDMYGVELSLWVHVAAMHVEGSAASWVQSTERQIRSMGWDHFCDMLRERFGRDHHEAFIRQLFHICQSGSVTEYVDQFSTLVDQLAAYEPNTNPLHYATRFVDGLRDDIKTVDDSEAIYPRYCLCACPCAGGGYGVWEEGI